MTSFSSPHLHITVMVRSGCGHEQSYAGPVLCTGLSTIALNTRDWCHPRCAVIPETFMGIFSGPALRASSWSPLKSQKDPLKFSERQRNLSRILCHVYMLT